ncbi:MAG: hypothetical protein WBA05_18665 [Gordonia sp. (in: high G+C Gram-positive bacteria)]|uniref:hypothetical protein n=1 Tax=Gordonia sp. (in: high G+C Gram-positive bacteria) TaxID=84139 RepID=UPI003C713B79
MITDLVAGAVNRVADLPRAIIRGVLSEAIDFLTEDVDLTEVLLAAVDLNRVLAAIDLQPVVERIDLNALLARVDLDGLLQTVDLNPILARLDLNPVLTGVDVEAIIARIDLDEVIGSVDLDAVLANIDLVVVGNRVIDGVDLSSIVRDAGSTVTTEMISDVRTGSERADDVVEGFVNRVLRRKSDDDE